MTDGADPQLARYSNKELENWLSSPNLNEAQRAQVRQELTRRLRDDLLRSAQGAIANKNIERRKRAWKMGRWGFLIIIALICFASLLCVLFFTQPELFHRIFGSTQAFLLSGWSLQSISSFL
jgi:hypothetical protein